MIYRQLRRIGIDAKSIKVDTVDHFQGGESEVVIISTVRSIDNIEKRNWGLGSFMDDPKRLNVAITRAKCSLFLFGNTDVLVNKSKDGSLWREYIPYLESNRFIEKGRFNTRSIK